MKHVRNVMNLPDLALGGLAGVIRCISYDAMDWRGAFITISALMKTAGITTDPTSDSFCSILWTLFSTGNTFDSYYRKIKEGSKSRAEDHDSGNRLIGVLVCLDLARDLSLFTNLDKFNFIFNDFLSHHRHEFCSETFEAIRKTEIYQMYKKCLLFLMVESAIFLRKTYPEECQS